VGEWDKCGHYQTLQAVRRFWDEGKVVFLAGSLIVSLEFKTPRRLSKIAHFCQSLFRRSPMPGQAHAQTKKRMIGSTKGRRKTNPAS
jgi:hypothetical protein